MPSLLRRLMLASLLTVAIQAQPQIGGGLCTNSTVSGIYYYLLSGDLISGGSVYPYVELGKLVADGQGSVSGDSHASVGGTISAYTLSGTYSVQSGCSGAMSLSVNGQPPETVSFQVVNGGQGVVVAFSAPSSVVTGRAYRQTANAGTIQCSTASLSGNYAYLLTGVAFSPTSAFYYSQAGSASGDGRGNMSAIGIINTNGVTVTTTGQGPYSLASDCSGTASIKNQNGTANYYLAVVEDGQGVLFMDSDAGYVVGGLAEPSSTAGGSNAVANGATYLSGGLVQGSWAQVKGANLATTTRPWAESDFTGLGMGLPTTLSGTQVTVNKIPAAIYYVSPTQINFQVPAGITGPATIEVATNGVASNAASAATATNSPGVFPVSLGGKNYAAAVFLDGKIAADPVNGPSFRNAVPGEVVQLFATGLIRVPAGVLPAPQTVSGVTVTIGSTTFPADSVTLVAVGEFQINFTVPSLPAGTYPISISIDGVTSPASIKSSPPGAVVFPIGQ